MPMIAAAGIGAAAQLGGAYLGGKATTKAAKKAAETQMKMTQLNNALAQWNYGQNAARLDPYAASGVRAGNTLNEILMGPAPAAGTGSSAGYFPSAPAPGVPYEIQQLLGNGIKGDYERALATWQRQQAAAPSQVGTGGAGVGVGGVPLGSEAAPSALSAWDQFRQGTNYNWRFGEGQRALNEGLGATMMDSGAARQAEQTFGQNFASNELSNWMNQLYQQQQVGANAAGNLAGVGNTLTQSMMQNNQSAADANANRALIGGTAQSNLYGAAASGISKIAGAYGSSYNQPQAAPAYNPAYYGSGGVYGSDMQDYNYVPVTGR